METGKRTEIENIKRIVFKVGTSTLTHEETGRLDLIKMEKFVRILTDLHNQGKEIVVVSSGAIAVGRTAMGLTERPTERSVKQACAAVGQIRLMTVYQKLFSEYNQKTAQILMTKTTIVNDISRHNAQNTFRELLDMGVIPIVNENDTVATDEIEDFGDNDYLSAIVSAVIKADLLVLLSDIDGLYTDDPNRNPEARRIPFVDQITDEMLDMAKGPVTDVGTGGMSSKVGAAGIANDAGADMAIINGDDMENINRLFAGEDIGTWFQEHRTRHFHLKNYLDR
ncbi:MAG: glutamate 5-kinase [Lachnospiraceae bacterium]|nr:glutamate 5-kinase [Lachnospiraceae bacterium]